MPCMRSLWSADLRLASPPVREVRPAASLREAPRTADVPPLPREIPRPYVPPPPPPVREVKPAAPIPPPVQSSSPPAGLESTIRAIVTQALDEFVKTMLPELIRKELANAPHEAVPGIRGNLASFRLVEVMQLLGLQRQSGRLAIRSSSEELEIFFRDGAVVFASANCRDEKAGMDALLRKSCRIDEDSLGHAMRIADMTGEPLDKILIREKLIDEKVFADCLRRHTESIVYKIMGWKDGEFYFEQTTAPVFAVPLQLKVDDLLLEGARRSDEL